MYEKAPLEKQDPLRLYKIDFPDVWYTQIMVSLTENGLP